MRKVLTVALVALFLFAGTGVLAVAEAPEKVKPGEKGQADPFHDPNSEDYSGSGVTPEFTHEVTPDNPISVGG